MPQNYGHMFYYRVRKLYHDILNTAAHASKIGTPKDGFLSPSKPSTVNILIRIFSGIMLWLEARKIIEDTIWKVRDKIN